MLKIAIVDGNNLAYKAYSVMKESRGGLLTNSVGIPTTVIFSMLRTFNALVDKSNYDRIIVCWDTSGSKYRRGIFPLYKRHRKHTDMQDYFKELDAAREHLDVFGIKQVIAKGIEADDVIGFLAHHLKSLGNKPVIVSDDKDFYQVVRPGIKIFRPIKDQFVTIEEVQDEFGLHPKDLAKIKAITGEDTDFIPGCCTVDDKDKNNLKLIKCGMGEKTAIKILGNNKSLTEAIDNWVDNPKAAKQWKPILLEKRNQIYKSYKLARIRINIKHYLDWEKEILNEVLKDILNQKEVKLRSVLRLKDDLEMKSMNIAYVLKKIGVKIKSQGLGSEKITV